MIPRTWILSENRDFLIGLSYQKMLEMERRDYAQITAQRLSTQQLSTQQHSIKPQHLRGALASTTSAAAAPVFRGSSA